MRNVKHKLIKIVSLSEHCIYFEHFLWLSEHFVDFLNIFFSEHSAATGTETNNSATCRATIQHQLTSLSSYHSALNYQPVELSPR